MAKIQVFRDPIHTQIRFENADLLGELPTPEGKKQSWVVRNLINCSAFQRLRHMRQNGLTNLVFFGAEHSRFPHSIGVCHMAGIMYDKLLRNEGKTPSGGERLSVCVAALLHDVGHGPFSHALEEILRGSNVDFSHEYMTVRIITEDEGISGLLSQVDPTFADQISKYISAELRNEDHWCYRIVSGELDADRLDYLLRDALFTGIRGHSFDIERLLDMLQLKDNAIAVDRKALEAVEAYLVSLDHMYRMVYHHHTVRVATRMLCSVFRRAFDLLSDGRLDPFNGQGDAGMLFRELFEKGQEIDVATYCRLSEFHAWSLIEAWQNSEDKILADLSQRLMERKLFKSIDVQLNTGFNIIEERMHKAKGILLDEFDWVKTEDEAGYYVTLDEPTRTSVKNYDWRASDDVAAIWMVGCGKPPCPVQDEDDSWIVNALKGVREFRRLLLPKEIKEKLTS